MAQDPKPVHLTTEHDLMDASERARLHAKLTSEPPEFDYDDGEPLREVALRLLRDLEWYATHSVEEAVGLRADLAALEDVHSETLATLDDVRRQLETIRELTATNQTGATS